MKFEEFKQKVESWAQVRGIYEQSSEAKQILKFAEELGEYLIAETEKDKMDAIGDMAVCIVNAAKFHMQPFSIMGNRYGNGVGDACISVNVRRYSDAMEYLMGMAVMHAFKFEDCMQMAWDEIKDRKGMMINGLFIKWNNLTTEQQNELQSRLDAHIEADC